MARTTYENYVPKTTYYAYDGDKVIEELDGDGNVIASFVYGNYVDEVLEMRRDTDGDGTPDTTYYYLHDDMFNVLALTDAAGNIVERYEYGDYGYPAVYDGNGVYTGNESAHGNPYLFNGHHWDADTELYWYRTRYMDPDLGRFISRDQIGLWGDANNLGNPFAYAGNNPWTYTDPYGEYIESGWDALSLGIGVASLGYNLSEGNYGSAALDTLGVVLDGAALAVPLVPGGAGAAIKGIRVLNAVDTTVNVGMAAHGTVDAIQQGDALGAAMQAGFGALGAGSLGRHANLPGGRGAQNLSAGGGNVGQGIGQGCRLMCFTDETLIQADSGSTTIGKIRAGDWVYSLDEDSGEVELKEVTALYKRETPSLYILDLAGETVETTREHPFYVEGQGWTRVEELREGDNVQTMGGDTRPVTGIEVVYKPTMVYNFTVDGNHNYYVSEDGFLVHNCPDVSSVNRSIWTTTKNKTSVENAYGHWKKHGQEFDEFQNANQYVKGTRDFLHRPPSTAMSIVRKNGDTVRFDPTSNRLAIMDSKGVPRTMFKPDPAKHGFTTNLEYFLAQGG